MNRLLLIILLMTTRLFAQEPHFLPMHEVTNARDLGGYVMQDGSVIRPGMLLRTASLAEAGQDDLDYLESLGVSCVVDFRLDFEKKGKEDKMIPHAKYVSLPINSFGDLEDEEELKRHKSFDISKLIVIAAFNKKAKEVAKNLYPTLFFNKSCQQQYAAFMKLVVAHDEGALLYHCTQGKDRTGLATVFILAALGADRKTIIADFDLTNQVYAQEVEKHSRRVKWLGGDEEELAVVKAFIGANTENFIRTLDSVDAQYGSLEGYLKGPLQMTDDDINLLRQRYCRMP